ncbi:2Fe-2S ferredoxin [Candidatus Contubernalis alkaliaceticus]|uniref:2Fe-2S ferredoxin n=1 Tax=Candidatus Contubernalis alkaliaceticus TaxID=338645 RepID=UPI001F4BF3FD|nr:2Fe-2S ferredoxin [Candidatus Contubernalis alkalaceticus]UNC92660.1 (2Fe-2S) ferredoxin domain-containing protein [Candidatus Contubernalis alkalaceticus]
MKKPKYHVFICSSSRINGQQKGFCHSKNSVNLLEEFMEEIEERGLGGDVLVTHTGCFGICEKGPVVVVYPHNVWYGGVTSDDIEVIMDEHIEGGSPVKSLEIN